MSEERAMRIVIDAALADASPNTATFIEEEAEFRVRCALEVLEAETGKAWNHVRTVDCGRGLAGEDDGWDGDEPFPVYVRVLVFTPLDTPPGDG